MSGLDTELLISDLLGSAHLFVSAVSGVMEEKLLSETAGKSLTLSQLKVLKLLEVTDARTVSDVAAFLGVSNAAASKSVERLVGRKYMRRTQAPGDRRSSELTLTAAGQRLLSQYEAAKNRRLAKVFKDFDPKDLSRATELLEQLTKGIVTHSANPEEICLQCGIYLQKRCLVKEVARADCMYQKRIQKPRAKVHATHVRVPARRRLRAIPAA
jgi:DNA-binding MarR family transcriptional regulator